MINTEFDGGIVGAAVFNDGLTTVVDDVDGVTVVVGTAADVTGEVVTTAAMFTAAAAVVVVTAAMVIVAVVTTAAVPFVITTAVFILLLVRVESGGNSSEGELEGERREIKLPRFVWLRPRFVWLRPRSKNLKDPAFFFLEFLLSSRCEGLYSGSASSRSIGFPGSSGFAAIAPYSGPAEPLTLLLSRLRTCL